MYATELAANVYLLADIDGQDLFKLKYKNDLDIGDTSTATTVAQCSNTPQLGHHSLAKTAKLWWQEQKAEKGF